MIKKVNFHSPPSDPYREALAAAQQEYDELQSKRAEIDARLARLRETLVSLSYLVSQDGETESLTVAGLGLTEAVAKVLRLSGMALTPANVRDELARMGFNIKRHKSIIPSITKVLKRLHEKGHVDATHGEQSEKTLYIWSPMQPNVFKWTEGDDEDDLREKVRILFGGESDEVKVARKK